MNNYETIIGIEVHAQLNTTHKIFSPSINNINDTPNTNVHPIDLGLPGTLPRFNEQVLQKAILVCSALEMDITKIMHWDRKNYFYPDNPKGYQITQQRTPIGRSGSITLTNGKVITVDFMHMEEDTAKSFHKGDETLLDFNRCGVPLVEIVTGPDMRNASEAREYLERLREILLYLNVCDGKMEEGSLRVDVNISVRPFGQKEFNTKVEIKNLNSFNNVELAIECEIKNQLYALNTGIKVVQCTKRFNETTKQTDIMRIKETVDDYHYFPEPDLPMLHLSDEYIKIITNEMPKLPNLIKDELIALGFSEKEINVILVDREMTLFLLKAVVEGCDGRQTFNYLTVNINEYLNKQKVSFKEVKFAIKHLQDLDIELESGAISSSHIKKIIPEILKTGDSVRVIIKNLGLEQITDETTILNFVKEALANNPDSIELHKSGKDRAFGFLVGQVMKLSSGQANPQLVNKLLREELDKND
ncbi:MAG: Asp-tRNA(Asn)/Glu-tRNA(Gln) amidotransferase subunit GatB [Spiroplasma sp.]|nr:Asp-tRNA(Asn)/Glu-tRNA(Gln) amidotransferase subunit GatB [Mycoplasmatales bacterium]